MVRYVLHRFFDKEYGWSIRGLEDGNGKARNDSTPLMEMQTWAPTYLQDFLEALLGGRGINLREAAVFAASLEHLIQQEEKRWLQGAYRTLWLEEDDSQGITTEKARQVLLTYMMIYLLAGDFTAHTPNEVERIKAVFRKKIKAWNETEQWIDAQNPDVLPLKGEKKLDFGAVTSMVQKLSEHFSHINDLECSRLKDVLFDMESQKPGRVRLADLYRVSLKNNAWEFSESLEYLRSIGATDEADPTTPLVLIPNYVAARPNCLPTSSFYVVCCRNQCDDLMSSLERDLDGPLAEPHRVAQLVTSLPSAPRNFSAKMLARLDDIARHNGGKVPVHGRLFAQWMHHVYPRECPYPPRAGTATARFPEEWMQETGAAAKATVSMEEMISHVSNDTCRMLPKGIACEAHDGRQLLQQPSQADEDEALDLPWDHSEELLVVRPHYPASGLPHHNLLFGAATDLFLLVALSTALSGLLWAFHPKGKRGCTGLALAATSSHAVVKEDRAV